MLTVTNGFKLYTSEPSSHDYHFQAMPSPITRTITAPYDPNDNPPYLINDMGELIMKCDAYDSSTLPVAEDCKITSFSFRTLSEPTRVQTISSAKGHPAYPNVYMPTVNGNWNTNTIGSWTPIKYCIYGFVQDAHINADGTIFYTVGSIYQAASFVNLDNVEDFRYIDLIHNTNGILLVPQSISQQEYLYTVSGS